MGYFLGAMVGGSIVAYIGLKVGRRQAKDEERWKGGL